MPDSHSIQYLTTPFKEKDLEGLHIGDKVFITGSIYVARDAAHQRIIETLYRKEKLPFSLEGQTIYYAGPTPAPPGQIIGSCGPTTSSRMDSYTPQLIALGLKGMIGKGKRSRAVIEAMKMYKAVYFGAVEGTAALLSQKIEKSDVIAYEDLGAEALRRFYVREFPVIVVNDIYGKDLYQEGMALYKRN